MLRIRREDHRTVLQRRLQVVAPLPTRTSIVIKRFPLRRERLVRDRQIYGLREPLGGLRVARRTRLEQLEGLLFATVELGLDCFAGRRVLRRFLRARRRRRVGLVVELAVLLLLARPPDERGDADAGGGRDGEGLRCARVSDCVARA